MSWLGTIVGIVGVSLTFVIVRCYFPRPLDQGTDRSFEELRHEFWGWSLFETVLYFVLWPCGAWMWFESLVALSGGVGFAQVDSGFVLRALRDMWLLPSSLLGLLSAGLLIEATIRRCLGSRFEDLVTYRNLAFDFDSAKFTKPLLFGVGFLAVVLVAAVDNYYVVLTETELLVNPFFGVRARVHRLEEVASIRTAPQFMAGNGRAVQRREYVLRFSDGSTWSTNDEPSDASDAQIRSLIESISARSGVPILEVEMLIGEDL